MKLIKVVNKNKPYVASNGKTYFDTRLVLELDINGSTKRVEIDSPWKGMDKYKDIYKRDRLILDMCASVEVIEPKEQITVVKQESK